MAYRAFRVDVTDVPVKILEGADGVSAVVRNADEALTVDLGGPDVVTAEGFELTAEQATRVPLNGRDDDLYAVAKSGESAELHVLVNA